MTPAYPRMWITKVRVSIAATTQPRASQISTFVWSYQAPSSKRVLLGICHLWLRQIHPQPGTAQLHFPPRTELRCLGFRLVAIRSHPGALWAARHLQKRCRATTVDRSQVVGCELTSGGPMSNMQWANRWLVTLRHLAELANADHRLTIRNLPADTAAMAGSAWSLARLGIFLQVHACISERLMEGNYSHEKMVLWQKHGFPCSPPSQNLDHSDRDLFCQDLQYCRGS